MCYGPQSRCCRSLSPSSSIRRSTLWLTATAAIVARLARGAALGGPGKLAAPLGVSLPTVLQHLDVLPAQRSSVHVPRRSARSAPAGSSQARCKPSRGTGPPSTALSGNVGSTSWATSSMKRSRPRRAIAANEHPSARLHHRTAFPPKPGANVQGVRRPRPPAALVPSARQLDRHQMVAGLPGRWRRAERGARPRRQPPPVPQPLPRHRRRRADRVRLRHAP